MPYRQHLGRVAQGFVCRDCGSSPPSIHAPWTVTRTPGEGHWPFDADAIHNLSGLRAFDGVTRGAMAMLGLLGAEATAEELVAHLTRLGQGDATLVESTRGSVRERM